MLRKRPTCCGALKLASAWPWRAGGLFLKRSSPRACTCRSLNVLLACHGVHVCSSCPWPGTGSGLDNRILGHLQNAVRTDCADTWAAGGPRLHRGRIGWRRRSTAQPVRVDSLIHSSMHSSMSSEHMSSGLPQSWCCFMEPDCPPSWWVADRSTVLFPCAVASFRGY